MTTGIEARIKAQEEKLKQLKAQKQQIEARKRAAAAKISRQQDTRRKVLAGAMTVGTMTSLHLLFGQAQGKLEEAVVHRAQFAREHAPFGAALAGGEGGHAADQAESKACKVRMVI